MNERESGWGDVLFFRKMITPLLIQVLFWVLVVGVVGAGLGLIVAGTGGGAAADMRPQEAIGTGIFLLLFGPLVVRVWCEWLMVVFQINNKLEDIRDSLAGRAP